MILYILIYNATDITRRYNASSLLVKHSAKNLYQSFQEIEYYIGTSRSCRCNQRARAEILAVCETRANFFRNTLERCAKASSLNRMCYFEISSAGAKIK